MVFYEDDRDLFVDLLQTYQDKLFRSDYESSTLNWHSPTHRYITIKRKSDPVVPGLIQTRRQERNHIKETLEKHTSNEYVPKGYSSEDYLLSEEEGCGALPTSCDKMDFRTTFPARFCAKQTEASAQRKRLVLRLKTPGNRRDSLMP
jgi:hypothetical protein